MSSSAIFEYEWLPTFFHRLHPFAKMAFLIFMGIVSAFLWHPVVLIPFTIAMMGICAYLKMPLRWYGPVVLIAFSRVILNVMTWIPMLYMTSTEAFVNLPQEFVLYKIVELPMGTSLTIGSLLWMFALYLQMANLLLITYIFFRSTSVVEICNALTTIKIPSWILFVFLAFIRFGTIIQRRTGIIMNAQKLRGWKESRNPITSLRTYGALLIPITSLMVKLVDELVIATRTKGFGVAQWTPTKIMKINTTDYVFSIALAIICGAVVYLNLTQHFGML